MPVPPEGLLLTSKLAEVLGVASGDSVVMEVLEGRRPHVVVPVARVVEAFFGFMAYMDMSALNRMLGDGQVITGANLLVDRDRMNDLHGTLKATPAVAAVGLRRESYRSFRETVGENMGIMSSFMVIFAVVIACGVVYNNARVILAERSRELASMRVLGYRRGEISSVLLGELWLLSLIAIPTGLLLGHVLTAGTLAGLETELYTLPFVIQPKTYGFAAVVVGSAAIASGLFVRRRLDRLDLVEVLKTRE